MDKTGVKILILSRSNKQLTITKGKTWSRGTNSRLPLGVHVNFTLGYSLILNCCYSRARSSVPPSPKDFINKLIILQLNQIHPCIGSCTF